MKLEKELQNLNYSSTPFNPQAILTRIQAKKPGVPKDILFITDAVGLKDQLNAQLHEDSEIYFQELKANGQLTKIKAVIGATQCETLDDVFDRIEKLPQYCFETKIRDKDALVRDELEFVLGGKDADLIYKHLNCEAYAEDVLMQYGAEITPYGMVNREDFGPLHEPIPEQQQEQTQEPQMGM